MINFHKPDWLYKLLPAVYIACGVGCLLWLDTGFGMLSGALLIVAGLLVWEMRRQGRKSANRTVYRR